MDTKAKKRRKSHILKKKQIHTQIHTYTHTHTQDIHKYVTHNTHKHLNTVNDTLRIQFEKKSQKSKIQVIFHLLKDTYKTNYNCKWS